MGVLAPSLVDANLEVSVKGDSFSDELVVKVRVLRARGDSVETWMAELGSAEIVH